MSSSLLETAMEQFYARMDAAEDPGLSVRTRSLLVLSGLDLDVDNASERMHDLAHSVITTSVLSGERICSVMADALVNAVAMGVLHERERAARDRVEDPQ